ncbi:PAAR domain-containing protein [Rhodovulum sulfidophilum]|uniref:PAAR domain-containing protein n=1 Tax=Rhodovulum sulfidophilum TaxID=35806 RepID=UPI001923BCAA|nr:PAAR domain-containing protein [Rhodovulum sulfidophilum]MBL3566102.1 PAAR domain-containing protein [Rhodovulum sulfidophilum]
MPAASRKGDSGSGHGCFPATPATSGSPDVLIDGIPALRQGDAHAAHGCKDCAPHGRAVSGGSPTVFVNGRPLARVGDSISCGGVVAAGSGTVIADEEGPRKVELTKG